MEFSRINDLLKLYDAVFTGTRSQEDVFAELNRRLTNSELSTEDIQQADSAMESLANLDPKRYLSCRLLNLEAARLTGHPITCGNTAYSAGLALVQVKHDYVNAAACWVEAIRVFSSIPGIPNLPMLFRNIVRIFTPLLDADPQVARTTLNDVILLLNDVTGAGFSAEVVLECAEPVTRCAFAYCRRLRDAPILQTLRDAFDRLSMLDGPIALSARVFLNLGGASVYSAGSVEDLAFARRCLDTAFRLIDQLDKPDLKGLCLMYIGDAITRESELNVDGEVAEVERVFQEAIRCFVQTGEVRKEAGTWERLGECRQKRQRYDEALQAYEYALQKYQPESDEDSIRLLMRIGTLHFRQNESARQRAVQAWRDAISLADRHNVTAYRIDARLGLARRLWVEPILDSVQRVEQALAVLDEAIEIAKATDDNARLAKAYHSKAEISSIAYPTLTPIGTKLQRALDAAHAALTYYTPERDRANHVSLLTTLAMVYRMMDDSNKALEAAAQAYHMSREDPDASLLTALNYAMLCELYSKENDELLATARKLVEEVQPRMTPDLPWLQRFHFASVQMNILAKDGRIEEAVAGARTCLDVATEGQSLHDQADALGNLGAFLIRLDRQEEAFNAYLDAAAQADVAWHEEARLVGNKPLTQVESYLQTLSAYQQRLYRGAAQLAHRLGRNAEALSLLEHSRARVINAVLRTASDETESVEETDDLAALIEAFVKKHPATAILSYFYVERGPVLCFIVTANDGVRAIQLPEEADALVKRILQLEGSDFQTDLSFLDAYRKWRRTGAQSFRTRWFGALQEAGVRLGRSLLTPVLEQLPKDDIRRLVIVPDRWMEVIPFHIARLSSEENNGRASRDLIDEFEIIQSPSLLSLIRAAEQPAATGGYLLVSGRNPDIPFSHAEVVDIEMQFHSRAGTFKGDRVSSLRSLEELRDLLAKPGLRLVHLASHMDYQLGRPADSSIRLELVGEEGDQEARISLVELLSGEPIGIPKGAMVVLSGCESAAYDLDLTRASGETFNLATTVWLAGARTVIASSWAAHDVAAFFLMRKFYTLWLTNGGNAAAALAGAQRWLKSRTGDQLYREARNAIQHWPRSHENAAIQPKLNELCGSGRLVFEHPYYWAGFNCIGYWRTYIGGLE